MKLWIGIGTTLLVGASTYAFCPPKQGQTTVLGTGNGVCVVSPNGESVLSADEVKFDGQVLTTNGGVVTMSVPGVATTTFGAAAEPIAPCPPTPPAATRARVAKASKATLESKVAATHAQRSADRARHAAERARAGAVRAKAAAERSAVRARALAPLVMGVRQQAIDDVLRGKVEAERAAVEVKVAQLAAEAATLDEARARMSQEIEALGYVGGGAGIAAPEACEEACTEACEEACEEACAEVCEEACEEECEDACDTVAIVEGVDLAEAPAAIVVEGVDLAEAPAAIVVEGQKISVGGMAAPNARAMKVRGHPLPSFTPVAPGTYKIAVGHPAAPSAPSGGASHGEHEAILHQLKVLTDEIRALREEVRAMHAASRITETY